MTAAPSSPPPRFVLRCRSAVPPEGDLARIRAAAGVDVVDEEGRTLLVAAEAFAIAALAKSLVGWTIAPEATTPPPGPPRARPRSS